MLMSFKALAQLSGLLFYGPMTEHIFRVRRHEIQERGDGRDRSKPRASKTDPAKYRRGKALPQDRVRRSAAHPAGNDFRGPVAMQKSTKATHTAVSTSCLISAPQAGAIIRQSASPVAETPRAASGYEGPLHVGRHTLHGRKPRSPLACAPARLRQRRSRVRLSVSEQADRHIHAFCTPNPRTRACKPPHQLYLSIETWRGGRAAPGVRWR